MTWWGQCATDPGEVSSPVGQQLGKSSVDRAVRRSSNGDYRAPSPALSLACGILGMARWVKIVGLTSAFPRLSTIHRTY